MRFVDPALAVGWVVAVVWVAWLAACLARALIPAGRSPGARSVHRRTLLVGLGIAVWLDVAQLEVVDSVEDHTGLAPADPAITTWFIAHRDAALTRVAKLVSDAGSTTAMGALALLAVVWLVWRRCWPQAGMVAVAALGAAVLGEVMKHVLDRARPPRIDHLVVETSGSLPSGHALGSAVVMGILTVIAFGVICRPGHRAALATIVVVVVVAVGLSRLYLGVHWATDVLTGWLEGLDGRAVMIESIVGV